MNDDAAEVNDPQMLSGSFLHEKESGYKARGKIQVHVLVCVHSVCKEN